MKIMSVGNGFVADHLPYEKIKERVILNRAIIKSMLEDFKPNVLINCIGRTGRPNIDSCETDKEETIKGNVSIPLLLAEVCKELNIHLINIGSGCIYFGESPNKFGLGTTGYAIEIDHGWKEDDFANPKSFYSKTKYSCDLLLGQMNHVTTLRIRMPISNKNVPRNLINKLRGYDKIINIPNSVTFMDDLVRCVDWAAKNQPGGTFHVTNPGNLTAAMIMQEYQKYVPNHNFIIIGQAELDSLTVAKRSNCILNTEKLERAGFQMTPSETALKHCMAQYIKNI